MAAILRTRQCAIEMSWHTSFEVHPWVRQGCRLSLALTWVISSFLLSYQEPGALFSIAFTFLLVVLSVPDNHAIPPHALTTVIGNWSFLIASLSIRAAYNAIRLTIREEAEIPSPPQSSVVPTLAHRTWAELPEAFLLCSPFSPGA